MDKELKKVLKKMCQMVKVDFKDINFKAQDWFIKYSWSIEKQDKFNNWFVMYLKKNTKARNELMATPFKDKKSIQKFVDAFVFNYGWKINE